MNPIITVVTVCYNAEHCIEKTLKSMLNQGNGDWQYIVIDGASGDATKSILADYSSIIDVLVIEPDEGIYDAMNKGLRLSKGRYVYFLNAGDVFHTENVLANVSNVAFEYSPDIIYGDLKTDRKIIDTSGIIRKKHKAVPHQCCFFSLASAPFFDTKYLIAADFKQFLVATASKSLSLHHIKLIVANYDSIKAEKNASERLKYDIQRTLEKIKICNEVLEGVDKVKGVLFYLIHLIKYKTGITISRN